MAGKGHRRLRKRRRNVPDGRMSKVNRLLKEAKIEAEVEAVDLKSVDRHLTNAAAYITIVREAKERDIPMINGIAFLTGMGQDAEFAKLVDAIATPSTPTSAS